MFGLLMFMYNPIITYLGSAFPVSGIYATAMMWLWGGLAVINMFGSGLKLLMKMQQR
jgi:hypothetical protein